MKLLSGIDTDEVSLVSRAANKRKFLLLKGDNDVNDELADLLETPFSREGALLDELRKDGVVDETVEKAFVAGVRLLKGIEEEFSPELIEKLGSELYGKKNPPLNTSSGDGSGGDLTGSSGSSDEDDPPDGSASGADTTANVRDSELSGSASGAKVAADKPFSDDDDDDWDDDGDDDVDKADFSADDRKRLASQGKAQSDGSYPIRNKSDLGNAIQAFGRSKNKSKTKSWIISRAKALGATSMLPDSWSVSKEDNSTIEEEGGTVETHAVPIQKEDGSWDLSAVPEESRPFYAHFIQKADQTATELEKTREQLAKADDTLLTRTMLEKAARFNHVAATDDLAPILKEASQSMSPENFEKLEALLSAAEERVSKGALFQEMGRTGLGDSTSENKDAYSKILAKADEMIEKSGELSKEAAFDRALRANPELYNEYMLDQGWGVS